MPGLRGRDDLQTTFVFISRAVSNSTALESNGGINPATHTAAQSLAPLLLRAVRESSTPATQLR